VKSLADSTVEQVVLTVQRLAAAHNVPYELVADGMLDVITDSLVVRLNAHIWGEVRTTLVRVPDGLMNYVKHHVRQWKHTPKWLRERLTVGYIDWQAEVFRAYPDFKAPRNLHGRQFDRYVVHTMPPLNLTDFRS
jgi:hypothetical protein